MPRGWALRPQLCKEQCDDLPLVHLSASSGHPGESRLSASGCIPAPLFLHTWSVPFCPHKPRAAKELPRNPSLGQILALVLGAAAERERGVLLGPIASLLPQPPGTLYLPGWEPAVKGRAREAFGT